MSYQIIVRNEHKLKFKYQIVGNYTNIIYIAMVMIKQICIL